MLCSYINAGHEDVCFGMIDGT